MSKKYKFIYVVNPLCASRSITSMLKSNNDLYGCKNIRPMSAKKIINKMYKGYVIFSSCRQPLKRVVSFYNKKILNASNVKKISVLAQFDGLRPYMKFEDFVRWLCSEKGNDENANPHWISQSKILKPLLNKNEKRKVRIYRLKSLNCSMKSDFKKWSIPFFGLQKRGKSSDMTIKPLYENYERYFDKLSKCTLIKIKKRYKKDYELLGYNEIYDR